MSEQNTGRFELLIPGEHRLPEIEEAIIDAVGISDLEGSGFRTRVERHGDRGSPVRVYVFDVPDAYYLGKPIMALARRAAEMVGQDVYLSWTAVTGMRLTEKE